MIKIIILRYVINFIKKQEPQAQIEIHTKIRMLQKYGPEKLSKSGDFKKISQNLSEIKIQHNKIWYRIICYIKGSKCILLHSFKKKSNKIPKNELETAKKRLNKLT